jgi:tyrocidine synthetase-3
MDMHHIISDGMSQNVIIKDFLALYNGETPPALALQYKDFSHWQQSEHRKEAIRHQQAFWLKEFAGEPAVLQLPTDFPRPAVKNFEGASLELGIGPDEITALKRLAENEGSTLFMVLLALYNVLLYKIGGQDDIVIGTPVAGRPHTDLEKMVGMFVNTLSLRNFVSPDSRFRDFLRVVRKRTLACLENQDYPYEELIEELNVERDASRNPLFDAALIVQNFEEARFTIPGLTLTPHDSDYGVSKFDIALVAEETQQRIKLSFVYATELFRKETIRRFAACFRNILAAVMKDPEIPLAEIAIIPAAEQQRILHEFNDLHPGYAPFPGSTGKETVVALFEAQVEKTPEKTALVFGEQRISYRRLNAMANGIAGRIRSAAPAGGNVALLFPSSVEMIVSLWGVLKAGCAYVPLNPAAPVERNRYILEDCRASMLLTTEEFAAGYSPVDRMLIVGPEMPEAENPPLAAGMDDICNIIYTSGTTGQPKGVEVWHKGIANFGLWRKTHYRLSEADSVLQLFSYFFDGYGANLYPSLLSGATLVITTEEDRLDPGKVVRLIRAEGVSSMVLTPTMYGGILAELEARGEKVPVRSVTLAGERLPPELPAKAAELMPGVELTNEYGLTETSVGATVYPVEGAPAYSGIPIGKPANNYTIYVMSGSQLQPIGVAGELCIGGEVCH